MTQEFYRDKLVARGVEVIIPDEDEIELVNRVIFDELCLGIVKDDSRAAYLRVIDNLKSRGAEAILLGCTELGLIVSQEDVSLPLFDTTVIHAKAAAEFALAD